MMKLHLQIHGVAAVHAAVVQNRKSTDLIIVDNATIEDLLAELDLRIDDVIVFVNGKSRNLDHRLQDADKVVIMDIILGG
jgi:sulfur carrier protein ThiS